jgi:hypothetical protein
MLQGAVGDALKQIKMVRLEYAKNPYKPQSFCLLSNKITPYLFCASPTVSSHSFYR